MTKKYKKYLNFLHLREIYLFLLKIFQNSYALQDYILNFKNELLKEVFIFDYYINEKTKEIKIGFRFIFQSS